METLKDAALREHLEAVQAWHKATARLNAAEAELVAARTEYKRAETAVCLASTRAADALKKTV